VARAVKERMPNERIVYFGDTAHLPYGEKSAAALQAYSIKAIDFLLKKKCKVVLIACNSASAAAYEVAKEYTGSRAKVLSVIDPTIAYVRDHFASKVVGLIGTRQTVSSGVYDDKLKAVSPRTELKSLATPLLASMIEEGFYQNTISKSIIHEYLSSPKLAGIESLILGCTHYPLISEEISAYFNGRVDIIDSAEVVAKSLEDFLTTHNLRNPATRKGRDRFFVSDYTDSFEQTTRIFFKRKVHLNLFKLWE
jgi:glutamate racemase